MTRPTRRRFGSSRRGRAVLPLVAFLLAPTAAAACGRGKGSEDDAYARKVREAVPRVEQAVGLRFKTPPRVEARSKTQVREFLERQFTESRTTRELTSKEAVYKRFGLLPDTLQLRRLLTDLLEEQIVGFYDPKTKKLYIVQGSAPEAAGLVLSHELVHALQDQYLNLDSIQNVEGDDDRVGAAQAVIEGQATVAQLGGGNVAARLPGGWDRVRQLIREQQSAMPVFASAPMVIQETLIFPYLNGAEFMRRISEQGVSSQALYRNLPASTEQILHGDAYGAKRDAPTRVTLPALSGATVAYQNTLGEFETRLFLFEHLQDVQAAARGARGWDGDRYALVDTPKGQGLLWLSVWDSAIDAGEFDDLVGQVIVKRSRRTTAGASADAKRQGRMGSGSSAGGERTVTGGGRSYALITGEVQGRPVVLYVDVPEGASTALLNLDAVRLQ